MTIAHSHRVPPIAWLLLPQTRAWTRGVRALGVCAILLVIAYGYFLMESIRLAHAMEQELRRVAAIEQSQRMLEEKYRVALRDVRTSISKLGLVETGVPQYVETASVVALGSRPDGGAR